MLPTSNSSGFGSNEQLLKRQALELTQLKRFHTMLDSVLESNECYRRKLQ